MLETVQDRGRVRRVAHGVAVAVVVDFVQRRAASVAQQAIAVGVELVADLGRRWEHPGVAVVAVAAGEAAGAQGGGAETVSVAVDLARRLRGRVAVVVDAVRDLSHGRVDRAVGLIAIAAPQQARGQRHARLRVAGHVAVPIRIALGRGRDRVAVVVEAVADLQRLGAHLRVRVVAVAVRGAVVVAVEVELAVHAGVPGGDVGSLAVLAGAGDAVGVVPRVARALVVHEDVRPGERIEVGVRDLRSVGVDPGREGVARIVLAIVASGHPDDVEPLGVGQVGVVRRTGHIAVAVDVQLVRPGRAIPEGAVAVVVQAVAELRGRQVDLEDVVVTVSACEQAQQDGRGLVRRPGGPARPTHPVDLGQPGRGHSRDEVVRGGHAIDEGHRDRPGARVLRRVERAACDEGHSDGRGRRQRGGRAEDQLLAGGAALGGRSALREGVEIVVGLVGVQDAVAVVVLAVAEGGAERVRLRRAGIDERVAVVAVVAEGALGSHVLASLLDGGPRVRPRSIDEADQPQSARLDLSGDQGVQQGGGGDPVLERDGHHGSGFRHSRGRARHGDDRDGLLRFHAQVQRREERELVRRLQGHLELGLERHALALEVGVLIEIDLVGIGATGAVVVLAVADLRGADLDLVVEIIAVALALRLAIVVEVHVAGQVGEAVAVVVLTVTDPDRPRVHRWARVVAVDVRRIEAIDVAQDPALQRGASAGHQIRRRAAIEDREPCALKRGAVVAVLVDREVAHRAEVIRRIAVGVELIGLSARLACLRVQRRPRGARLWVVVAVGLRGATQGLQLRLVLDDLVL